MKRTLDRLVATSALVLLSPLIVAVACLVRIRLGKPVFFKQWRLGLDGWIFESVKFRSMSDTRAPDGTLASDAARLTPFGRWLRATSLDELPTLWNVLVGDMIVVNLCPLLVESLPLYDAEQARRHVLRPGVTGWAQVNGRNALEWRERFRFDTWYVDNWGFALDLRILWLTAGTVWRREGITAFDEAVTSRFAGNYELTTASQSLWQCKQEVGAGTNLGTISNLASTHHETDVPDVPQ